MIDYVQLDGSRDAWKGRFSTAKPFPHLVVDQLFESEPVHEAASTFPGRADMTERPGRPGVFELADRESLSPPLLKLSDELMGERFKAWLSFVTGVDDLLTDPYGIWGALRQYGDGVEVNIHAPPGPHPTKPWDRRLTLILHLGEGLREANGGCFELWDAQKKAPSVSIAPLFNRAIVFLATPASFHSASRTRLALGQTRKIVQILYFSRRSTV